jgi:hypothetical protein
MKFRRANPLRDLPKEKIELMYNNDIFMGSKTWRRWIIEAYCEKTSLKLLSDK